MPAWRSSRSELKYSFLDQHPAQSVGCEEEAKRFISSSNLNELKEKVRLDTLKVQGVYLAWICLWGSLSPEIGKGLYTYIH